MPCFRSVRSDPMWGIHLGTILPAGRTEVTFYIDESFDQNNETSCNLVITILDIENPKVYGCPDNMEYTLPRDQSSQLVYWKEPEFSDNVGISTLYKSRVRFLLYII